MFLGWVSWKRSLDWGSGTGESLRESYQVQREREKQVGPGKKSLSTGFLLKLSLSQIPWGSVECAGHQSTVFNE